MLYRKDINGLRAIAVLSVLFFHVDFSYFSGGYLGVDVFFVISGYLITKILYLQYQTGRLSLKTFYLRRTKRLLPALFVMLFLSLIVLSIQLPSTLLLTSVESIFAATFSISNILFYTQAGYFDVDTTTKPFLHTWSLGVEEQFYLVWPLLLILVFKLWGYKKGSYILLCLGVISFIWNIIEVKHNVSAAFYLSHLRGWEFVAGASCIYFERKNITQVLSNTLFILGLLLLFTAFFYYDDSILFPGYWALPPVFASVLLIITGNRTSFTYILENKLCLYLGTISYSLYLYHWPIRVIYERYVGRDLLISDSLLIIVLSFIFGALSYHLVEENFKDKKVNQSKCGKTDRASKNFIYVLLPLIVLLPSGYIWLKDGLITPVPSYIMKIASGEKYDPSAIYRRHECFIMDDFEDYNKDLCMKIKDSKNKNILIIGDSHAAHLWFGVNKVFDEYNVLQATSASCHPLIGYQLVRWKSCKPMVKYIFNELIFTPNRMVILAAKWNKKDFPYLRKTIQFLEGNQIPYVFLGPTISYHGTLPSRIAEYGKLEGLPEYLSKYLLKHRSWDMLFSKKMNMLGANYLSIYDAICTSSTCPALNENNDVLQYDYSHLTAEGSIYFAQKLKGQIIDKLNRVNALQRLTNDVKQGSEHSKKKQ
ncbi:acyltransferase family protein [Thalassotalea piscium]